MAVTTTYWAGKALDAAEELRLRELAALMRRCGEPEGAAELERFLPEHMGAWTPDQLELGAHMGPWFDATGAADTED